MKVMHNDKELVFDSLIVSASGTYKNTTER